LGDLLRSLLAEHHSQWDQILPHVEFSYNNSPNWTIGQIPFHIMYGMQPRGVYELRDLEKNDFRSAGAEYFATEMQELHNKIKERLQSSNQEYKHREDQHRRQLQFKVGDLFLAHLRKERFPRGTYNKMNMKNIGLCNILRKFEENAYEIELPNDVRISPIFNVVDLYPYIDDELKGEEN
jgi:hypothetical protein